ncbi:MAG: fibronectin type III domain-containing protein [Ilumatobacteraceae bacterium]
MSVEANRVVSQRTEILQAGVTGYSSGNDSFPNTNIRVAAFAEIGNVIFVGGKFTGVQQGPNGPTTAQGYLAAFDRNTGAWISSFRPVLDGNVWDLQATPGGKLLVSGQFSNVNGVADTAAIAMLDPVTGAVDPAWRVRIRLTGTTTRPIIRGIDVEGNWVYLAGNFTRVMGPNGQERSVGRLARVRLDTANGDGAFLPNVDGVVFKVDADGDRVYAVGNFKNINNTFSIGLGVLQASNGQLVPNLQPMVRTYVANTNNSYQQDVLSLGDEVWQVGAQHAHQVYRASDYALIRGWVTDPWGDGQALAYGNGIVYGGSHANGDTYMYADATSWPELTGWTSRTRTRWMGAWDAERHEFLDWYPEIGTENGEGAWALFVDSTKCLWAGGDFNRGSFDGSVARYVGGFAKFCPGDSTPPAPPTNPTATLRNAGGVNLAWTASTGDDRGGEVRYEVLKNDSVLASFISITSFADATGTASDRYFVRATDAAGNKSATTAVFTAVDATPPSTPQGLTAELLASGEVALTWSAATDNVGVAAYTVFRNGVEVGATTETSFTVPPVGPGTHDFQVQARDAAGNLGNRTPSVRVEVVASDTTPPTTPQDVTAVAQPNGDIVVSWTAATDDVGVADYVVFRNGVDVGVTVSTTFTVPAAGPGAYDMQVQARDTSGNVGNRSAPVRVDIVTGDTTKPTTPQNLAAAVQPDGDVLLTWNPATDNVGVTAYLVLRNGVEIGTATTTTFTVPAPAPGSHYYQVQARDAAGNLGNRTAPVRVDI